MAFIEKLKQIATGKTEIERKQSSAATQIIRAKARAAAFREREKQEIRYATAREKAVYDRKVAALNRPRPTVSAGGGLNFFREQPQQSRPQPSRTVVKYVPVKKGKRKMKKGKFRRVVIKQRPVQQPQQPQRFDVLGGSPRGNGYRII